MVWRSFAWPIRAAVYALVGVLTFILQPPGATAIPMQLTGYLVAGLGLLAWLVVERYPAAIRYRLRVPPVVLGVIATAAGIGATAGSHENSCMVMLAHIATLAAGAEFDTVAAWAITGLGVLSIDANAVIFADGYQQLSNYLLLPLVPLSGLLFGRALRGRRIQADQAVALLSRTRELQDEQRRADVLGERARIAREIHDVLAHSLGALGIQIQAARAVLTDHRDIDRAIDVLVAAQRMAAEGLAETRRAVHALRSDTGSLDEELDRVTGVHAERHAVEVAFSVDGVPRPLPPDATVALLRTAQEALVNAARHAEGRPVAVRLCYGEREVRLAVVNDLADGGTAVAIGPSSITGGYGLTGMHERLRLLNGTLEAGPRGGRWVVIADLPLADTSRPRLVTP